MAQRTRAKPASRRRRKESAGAGNLQILKRLLARLTAARETEGRRHARQLAAVRRAADQQLAVMMREIATLRHLEARADALARLVAERDGVIATQRERIAQLETLLKQATPHTLG